MQNWLLNSPGKRYQMIRICLTREVETPSFPIRICLPDVKHPGKLERHPARIPNVIHPGGKWRQLGIMWRQLGVMWRQPGVNGGSGCNGSTECNGGIRVKWWQPGEMTAVGWNEQDPILLVFWICLWIPKNSPQSRIALVIKKLSKHQNLTQFD